ncbi:MAG TPA: hypothetical protein VNS49_04680 [Streptomyces sp.]|nr:hypothetical protein [Streptomyces sp.]
MHRNNSAHRGFLVIAAAAGLWVLGTGGVQANEEPPARATAGDVAALEQIAERPVEKTGTCRGAVDQDVKAGAGKAITSVTEEAGKAVSTTSPAPAHKDVGAVSRVPAAPAAPSAPGLPEDLVIEIPQLLPGVPSIGILPASLPALPVTPGVPAL